jgi:hypothetical protein
MENWRTPRDPGDPGDSDSDEDTAGTSGGSGAGRDPRDARSHGESTASRVEDWLRGLRAGRAQGGGPGGAGGPGATGGGGDSAGRVLHGGPPGAPDDAAEAFLKAARRLAASPRAQAALARRLAEGTADGDPSLQALAGVLETLGRELAGVLGSSAGAPPGGAAAILERPEAIEERRLSDDEGGGGDDDIEDDDEGGGGGDDEEPWPSAFIGYRVGLVDGVDIGTCRDGCCTAVFMEHPGVRAAIWFPTETASALAEGLGELLREQRGEAAGLGVPPFGAGDPPARGQVQAAIQFFTEDVHLDVAESEADRRQGGLVRLIAYDQGLGHGGPPLVDALLSAAQARALRRGLRRAVRDYSSQG